MEIICSKTYFSLLYELFKFEVPKITQKWDWNVCGTYNTNSTIKFKTSMLMSSLCDYSDAYILVNGTITITGDGDDDNAKRLDEGNKGIIFKKLCTIH